MDSGIKAQPRVFGLLANYHIWMRRRGIDEGTIKRYCSHIDLFRNYISLHPERYAKLDTNPETAARAVREFIDYCYLTNRLSMRTTDHILIALNSFFAYLGMDKHTALRLALPVGKTRSAHGKYYRLAGGLTALKHKTFREQLIYCYLVLVFLMKSTRAGSLANFADC